MTEVVLNPVSGSRAGVVGVHQRHGWEREKAEALRSRAMHVVALIEDQPAVPNAMDLVAARRAS